VISAAGQAQRAADWIRNQRGALVAADSTESE